MTREEAKSCIGTIELLRRLAYNIHGVMDVIDADNCEKIIKALEQEPCGDAISKQAVFDLLVKYDNDMEFDVYSEIFYNIDKLPSVNPQEHSRDMEEIAEIMRCDANAETKCKMISNILTAKPHYFEEQEPKVGE